MISFLGRGAVLVALAIGMAGAVMSFLPGNKPHPMADRLVRWLAYAFAACITVAAGLMEYALLSNDFSVSYVAEVGSLATPWHLSIASLWSSLDGSLLFWVWVLAIEIAVFAWFTHRRHPISGRLALGVLLAGAVFFALLVASLADPFTPQIPIPTDGPGPNALLQNHLLMVVHPPALYLGYVGMNIPFAMAAAVLLTGDLDRAWMHTLRRWALVAWSFMTLGILLGGWWSYEVLGWGGYWSWDPVENASLLPWLAVTALLHAAMVTQFRRRMVGWTLTLALVSYLLTLLGTFMTRSGVFNSVHAFTQSSFGPVFLGFIAAVFLFSVFILASGLDRIKQGDGVGGTLSREGGLLASNLVFSVFTATVLLGTIYPLLNEALTGGKVSVGKPYFEKMCLPLCVLMLALMVVGPLLPWGRAKLDELWREMVLPAVLAVLALGLGLALGTRSQWALITYALAGGAAAVSLQIIVKTLRQGSSDPWRAISRHRRKLTAQLAHLGVAMAAVAIAASTAQLKQQDLDFAVGQSQDWLGFTLAYQGTQVVDEGYRVSQQAVIRVSRAGQALGELSPALNHYRNSSQPIGSPGILSRVQGDLYLSLMRVDPKTDAVSVRALSEPLVSWLWVAGFLMALAGLLAAWPRLRSAAQPASDNKGGAA